MRKIIIPAVEISTVFMLILTRIWCVDKFGEWPIILGILIATISWIARGGTLGLWHNDFRQVKNIARFLFGILLIVLFLALTFNPDFLWTPKLLANMAWSLAVCFPLALIQQLILNGYFANRLQSVYKDKALTACISGTLFAAVYLPNPTLSIACLLGGMASSYFFLKSKNIYPLAIAHALIAVTMVYSLPASWHHGMKIGPGFFVN